MGCRCNERGAALKAAAASAVRGNVKAASQSLAYVGRTMAQDVRSGAIKAAATARLAQLRGSIKR